MYIKTQPKVKDPFVKLAGLNGVNMKDNSGHDHVFTFDGVFNTGIHENKLYINSLLPLLEAVFYDHKDATLISFGPKNTGKSTILGINTKFYKRQNMLNESLNYFYGKAKETSDLM